MCLQANVSFNKVLVKMTLKKGTASCHSINMFCSTPDKFDTCPKEGCWKFYGRGTLYLLFF